MVGAERHQLYRGENTGFHCAVNELNSYKSLEQNEMEELISTKLHAYTQEHSGSKCIRQDSEKHQA
jgi:hypothetical protein